MFARGSARYLAPVGLLGVVLVATAPLTHPLAYAAAGLVLVAFAFMLWFFRDPERVPGPGVTSPADGKVLDVVETDEATRIIIFMSPLDVHVNRAPLDGRVLSLQYHRGGHRPAFNKESEQNERLEVDMDTPVGPVRVRLIAGTVARRIHPYIAAGNPIKKGQRIGLIAFGSRCELRLPPRKHRVLVRPGQRVKAGETPVADLVKT